MSRDSRREQRGRRNTQEFKRYLTPAKKTRPFARERHAFKFELSKGDFNLNGITRHGKSPVAGEGEPAWELMLHARERKGEPFVSGIYRMNLVDYSTVIMLTTFALCRKLGCNPVDFMLRMAEGLKNCLKSGGIYAVEEGDQDDEDTAQENKATVSA